MSKPLSFTFNVQCINLKGNVQTLPIPATNYNDSKKEFKNRFPKHIFIKSICQKLT